MADLAVSTSTIDGFFRRWEASGAAERANYSMFLNELCDLLDVPRPDPAGPDDEKNAYVFERAVPLPNPDGSTTVKRIDLYKRDCFALEAKQRHGRRHTLSGTKEPWLAPIDSANRHSLLLACRASPYDRCNRRRSPCQPVGPHALPVFFSLRLKFSTGEANLGRK